jgi:hypothetical protein
MMDDNWHWHDSLQSIPTLQSVAVLYGGVSKLTDNPWANLMYCPGMVWIARWAHLYQTLCHLPCTTMDAFQNLETFETRGFVSAKVSDFCKSCLPKPLSLLQVSGTDHDLPCKLHLFIFGALDSKLEIHCSCDVVPWYQGTRCLQGKKEIFCTSCYESFISQSNFCNRVVRALRTGTEPGIDAVLVEFVSGHDHQVYVQIFVQQS